MSKKTKTITITDKGVLCPSRKAGFPDMIKWTLADGGAIYGSPRLQKEFDARGIAPGVPFEVEDVGTVERPKFRLSALTARSTN